MLLEDPARIRANRGGMVAVQAARRLSARARVALIVMVAAVVLALIPLPGAAASSLGLPAGIALMAVVAAVAVGFIFASVALRRCAERL